MSRYEHKICSPHLVEHNATMPVWRHFVSVQLAQKLSKTKVSAFPAHKLSRTMAILGPQCGAKNELPPPVNLQGCFKLFVGVSFFFLSLFSTFDNILKVILLICINDNVRITY